MKKLFTIILMVLLNISFAQNPSEKYHRAKIHYNNSSQLEQLESVGIPIDHGFHKKNVSFESDFSKTDIEKAKALGFNVEIIIEDVRSFYLNRNDPSHHDYQSVTNTKNAACDNTAIDYQTPTNYDIKASTDFGGFYTYSEILLELDDMATQYPNLITSRTDLKDPSDVSIPHKHETAEGRYLQWVKISDNPNSSEAEPQILYTALHHAREPASLQQLIFYMWYLLENYDTDAEIKAIVDNTELFFIPVVNPDGYLYNESTNPNGGGFWRKNRRNHGNGDFGVDLNRNYSYITPGGQETWNTSGTSNSTAGDTYAGAAPFSEPETKAIRYFVESHNFKIAINNHTFSELLLYPFGYANNQPTADNATFSALSELMVSQNGYANILASELYAAAGDSDDSMYGFLTTESGGTREKIFAMTPEIGSSFWPAASSIETLCKDMMFNNLSAAQLVGNYSTITDESPKYSNNISTTASYNLKRLGLSEPANFTVSINPTSSNIQSVGSSNSHNNLNFLQELNDNISLNLNPGIAVGEVFTYELIVNNGLFDKKITVSKTYGQPTTVFDELGNDTVTNWTTSDWASTTEDFVSSSSSITDSPNANYSNGENNIITLTNEIDLSGVLGANLAFQAKWDIEPNYDYVQIEISADNGISWVPQCGNFTNTGVPNQNDANGEPLYDGTQSNWVAETIDLSDYIDESILIRFKLVSDFGVTEDGFYFDDLKLNILENNLNINEFYKENFRLYPNPVNSILNIKTSIQNYDISIYNLQGLLVYKSLELSNNSEVNYSRFSAGVYIMNINSENGMQSFKIIKQ